MTICHKLDVIPDLLAVHARKPDTYPYLLASNTRGNQNSRYSILMAHPQEITTQIGAEDDCLREIDVDPKPPEHPDREQLHVRRELGGPSGRRDH